jgi:hypothetical protein
VRERLERDEARDHVLFRAGVAHDDGDDCLRAGEYALYKRVRGDADLQVRLERERERAAAVDRTEKLVQAEQLVECRVSSNRPRRRFSAARPRKT